MNGRATLLLCLAGPMQSWGTRSRFDERDTNLEPSKSGVLGLVCAALGRDRSEPIDDLAGLQMGVRVDREGVLKRDFQTAQNIAKAKKGSGLAATTISQRYYLSDAVFLVGLEGPEQLLERCLEALREPRWALSLGRKSYVPDRPISLPDGLQNKALTDALADYPLLVNPPPKAYRRVIEAESGAMRMDQPLAAFSTRRFGPRYVETTMITQEA